MKAIAACVLGGISLLGGRHAGLRTVWGLFPTQIDTVLALFKLPAWWNDFIAGLVLLGVLVLDGVCARRWRVSAGAEIRSLPAG